MSRFVTNGSIPRAGWQDPLLAVLLFAGTARYLAAFPLAFSSPDEPHYLHEAKRLLAGEVMYRSRDTKRS